MENLIEKLKGLDKKVLIGAGVGLAVVIILIIALVIGLGNNNPSGGNTQGNSQNNSQIGTQAGTQTGTQAGTENDATEVIGTEDVTEIETEIGTETEVTESESEKESEKESESESESQKPSSSQKPSESQKPSNSEKPSEKPSESQKPSNSETESQEQEILGKGSKDDPYEDIPNLENMTYVTEKVPAGKTLYYKIQRIGGMYLTIEDANAYVIDSAGKRHDAKNGKVYFQLENAMANEYVLVQIGNTGSSAKAFTLKFTNAQGSHMNPEVISGNGPFTKHLNAGDEAGYYYSIKAAQTGTLRIYMSATAKSEMNVQNMDPNVTIARKLTEDAQTDEQGRQYIDFPVKAGEEIRIHVQAIKPTRGSIPATDITFEFAYK